MDALLAPEWLVLERVLGYRPALKGTAAEVVATYNAMSAARAAQAPPPDESVHRHDQVVEGIPIRVYTPLRVPDTRPLPIGVFAHSGGFLVGDLDSEDVTCSFISKHTPCIIVSVDYSLAPKVQMPTQLYEYLAVYKWVHGNAATLKGDAAAVFAIGGSAGGSLSLLATNELVRDPATRALVKGCVSLCPATWHPDNQPPERAAEFTSYAEYARNAPSIDGESMTLFFETVGMNAASTENCFVGLSTHLNHFPPTYIAICGADPIRDDGIVFEKMLKEAGVRTKTDSYPGLPHYFWAFPGIPQSQKFFDDLIKGVIFVLGK